MSTSSFLPERCGSPTQERQKRDQSTKQRNIFHNPLPSDMSISCSLAITNTFKQQMARTPPPMDQGEAQQEFHTPVVFTPHLNKVYDTPGSVEQSSDEFYTPLGTAMKSELRPGSKPSSPGSVKERQQVSVMALALDVVDSVQGTALASDGRANSRHSSGSSWGQTEEAVGGSCATLVPEPSGPLTEPPAEGAAEDELREGGSEGRLGDLAVSEGGVSLSLHASSEGSLEGAGGQLAAPAAREEPPEEPPEELLAEQADTFEPAEAFGFADVSAPQGSGSPVVSFITQDHPPTLPTPKDSTGAGAASEPCPNAPPDPESGAATGTSLAAVAGSGAQADPLGAWDQRQSAQEQAGAPEGMYSASDAEQALAVPPQLQAAALPAALPSPVCKAAAVHLEGSGETTGEPSSGNSGSPGMAVMETRASSDAESCTPAPRAQSPAAGSSSKPLLARLTASGVRVQQPTPPSMHGTAGGRAGRRMAPVVESAVAGSPGGLGAAGSGTPALLRRVRPTLGASLVLTPFHKGERDQSYKFMSPRAPGAAGSGWQNAEPAAQPAQRAAPAAAGGGSAAGKGKLPASKAAVHAQPAGTRPAGPAAGRTGAAAPAPRPSGAGLVRGDPAAAAARADVGRAGAAVVGSGDAEKGKQGHAKPPAAAAVAGRRQSATAAEAIKPTAPATKRPAPAAGGKVPGTEPAAAAALKPKVAAAKPDGAPHRTGAAGAAARRVSDAAAPAPALAARRTSAPLAPAATRLPGKEAAVSEVPVQQPAGAGDSTAVPKAAPAAHAAASPRPAAAKVAAAHPKVEAQPSGRATGAAGRYTTAQPTGVRGAQPAGAARATATAAAGVAAKVAAAKQPVKGALPVSSPAKRAVITMTAGASTPPAVPAAAAAALPAQSPGLRADSLILSKAKRTGLTPRVSTLRRMSMPAAASSPATRATPSRTPRPSLAPAGAEVPLAVSPRPAASPSTQPAAVPRLDLGRVGKSPRTLSRQPARSPATAAARVVPEPAASPAAQRTSAQKPPAGADLALLRQPVSARSPATFAGSASRPRPKSLATPRSVDKAMGASAAAGSAARRLADLLPEEEVAALPTGSPDVPEPVARLSPVLGRKSLASPARPHSPKPAAHSSKPAAHSPKPAAPAAAAAAGQGAAAGAKRVSTGAAGVPLSARLAPVPAVGRHGASGAEQRAVASARPAAVHKPLGNPAAPKAAEPKRTSRASFGSTVPSAPKRTSDAHQHPAPAGQAAAGKPMARAPVPAGKAAPAPAAKAPAARAQPASASAQPTASREAASKASTGAAAAAAAAKDRPPVQHPEKAGLAGSEGPVTAAAAQHPPRSSRLSHVTAPDAKPRVPRLSAAATTTAHAGARTAASRGTAAAGAGGAKLAGAAGTAATAGAGEGLAARRPPSLKPLVAAKRPAEAAGKATKAAKLSAGTGAVPASPSASAQQQHLALLGDEVDQPEAEAVGQGSTEAEAADQCSPSAVPAPKDLSWLMNASPFSSWAGPGAQAPPADAAASCAAGFGTPILMDPAAQEQGGPAVWGACSPMPFGGLGAGAGAAAAPGAGVVQAGGGFGAPAVAPGSTQSFGFAQALTPGLVLAQPQFQLAVPKGGQQAHGTPTLFPQAKLRFSWDPTAPGMTPPPAGVSYVTPGMPIPGSTPSSGPFVFTGLAGGMGQKTPRITPQQLFRGPQHPQEGARAAVAPVAAFGAAGDEEGAGESDAGALVPERCSSPDQAQRAGFGGSAKAGVAGAGGMVAGAVEDSLEALRISNMSDACWKAGK